MAVGRIPAHLWLMKRTFTLLLVITGSFILSGCFSLGTRGRGHVDYLTTDEVTIGFPRSATIETPNIQIR
jgi:hypothetical protein